MLMCPVSELVYLADSSKLLSDSSLVGMPPFLSFL